MTNLTLIEQLTWAIIEVGLKDGRPDLNRVSEVLAAALGNAIVAREQEKKMQTALIRTAAVTGESIDGGK